jgi:hypothetical protein
MAEESRKVVAIRRDAGWATKTINRLAQASENVFIKDHALQRVLERGFTDADVIHALQVGFVHDEPGKGRTKKELKAKVLWRPEGSRTAGVVTVIKDEKRLIVITVEWEI